uniref:Uncharacterized protein n=1 Tax=Drosophila-associated filamentous virus TaxID=2743186 RepID=A0A6M9U088_9VIRU|nr:putative protein 32 [Drosophila-associated filamentous virus]
MKSFILLDNFLNVTSFTIDIVISSLLGIACNVAFIKLNVLVIFTKVSCIVILENIFCILSSSSFSVLMFLSLSALHSFDDLTMSFCKTLMSDKIFCNGALILSSINDSPFFIRTFKLSINTF